MDIEAIEHEKPKHDATWWIGQAIALTVTAGLIWHGYAGPVAAAVGYALAVLVDIREAVCAPNVVLSGARTGLDGA